MQNISISLIIVFFALALVIDCIAMIRIPSKKWANWYNDARVLQIIGSIILVIPFLSFAILQLVYESSITPLRTTLDIVLFLLLVLALFFIIRASWVLPKE